MRYNEESKRISITVKELVRCARRGICTSLPYDEDEPTLPTSSPSPKRIEYPFSIGKYELTLIADVSQDGNKIRLTVPTDTSPRRPRKETVREARGEGFILSHVIMEGGGAELTEVEYEYLNKSTGEENLVTEYVKKGTAKKFFDRCKAAILVYARPEIERVTQRLPSMRGLKFPYKSIREGQHELIQSVYKNVARGGRLFTSAPTGTGKTVSTIYPAVRAMGDGYCEKIFYFTPKTTTAHAARDCIARLCEVGCKIRAIILSSKERSCENRLLCRKSRALCENSRLNKIADAVLELYDTGAAVVEIGQVREVARKYKICPYELQLSYSELCDVIICDVNYLFDRSVYIRRFFTDGGSYAFLIDEAHNLPDRAREAYSAEISSRYLASPSENPIFGEHSKVRNLTRGATSELERVIFPYVRDDIYTDEHGVRRAAVHISSPPDEMYGIIGELVLGIEGELYSLYSATDEQKDERLRVLREYYYTVKKFESTLNELDSAYEVFIFYTGDEYRIKLFCIDPSRSILARLKKGRSAVFFSGTLSPTYYYSAVLGGERDSRIVEIDSPFDKSQLSVCIMDKISTRSSEREDTLSAVCRAIAATVSARRGNYMIFSPSFAYSAALAEAFRKKYPHLHVIEQTQNMSAAEKAQFLSEFEKESSSYLIGFCVMGGIYSEGVDLAGESLIGAVIVGIGIPALSFEREAIAAYYDEKYEEGKLFAYVYPGMNRVLQAAGRVIRRESDRGVVVLIDDRFDDPIYKKVIPSLWSDMKFIADPKDLRRELDEFWGNDKQK